MAALSTSRYGGLPGVGGSYSETTDPTWTSTNENSNTNGTSNSNTVSNSQQYGGSNQVQTTNQQNMDSQSLLVLHNLIQQLMGGGTPLQQQQQGQRQGIIDQLTQQLGGFTKQAAINDSQTAMNGMVAQALKQTLPTLLNSAEGAGTSQGSMRGLLTQFTADDAAQRAAQLGLNQIDQYGQLTQGLGGTLNQLTSNNDVVTSLLNALQTMKGATQTGTNVTNGSQWSNNTQVSNTIGNTTNATNTNQVKQTGPVVSTHTVNDGMSGSGATNGGVPSGFNPGWGPVDQAPELGAARPNNTPDWSSWGDYTAGQGSSSPWDNYSF